MIPSILGKWQQPAGQAFAGLWFQFNDNGTFQAAYPEMGITSSGTYQAQEGLIEMDQTQHTLGLTGHFDGRYSIEGNTLILNLADLGAPRSDSLEGRNRRIYQKVSE
jgi:hypothetical protein